MLINLINSMLIDYDGVSEDTYCDLLEYLRRDDASVIEQQILRLVTKQIKAANGRYYITENLELINE